MFIQIHNDFIGKNAKIAFFDMFTSFHFSSPQSLHSQNLSRVSNIHFICSIFIYEWIDGRSLITGVSGNLWLISGWIRIYGVLTPGQRTIEPIDLVYISISYDSLLHSESSWKWRFKAMDWLHAYVLLPTLSRHRVRLVYLFKAVMLVTHSQ